MEFELCIPNDIIPTIETKIRIGKEILIPPIGIGTWSWGDSLFWGWNTYDKSHNEKNITEAFFELSKNGFLFYDTAEVYGPKISEQILNNLRLQWQLYNKDSKKNMVIASKWFPWPWRLFPPNNVISPLRSSLDRLGINCCDLYQVHAPIHFVSVESIANILADALNSGLIKSIGVSNYSLKDTIRMYEALQLRKIQLASNQIQFSLIRRRPETSGFIKACLDLGIAILAYSPLAMGVLTGKFNENNKPPGLRKFTAYGFNEMKPLLSALNEISLTYNKSMAQVAINWVICKGAVPLCGVKNLKQAKDNIGSLGWRLKDKDVNRLDQFSLSGRSNFIYADSS